MALSSVAKLNWLIPGREGEFTSAACWGLVLAAGEFDPSRGIAFWSYAWYRIRGTLSTEIAKVKRLRGCHRRVDAYERDDHIADSDRRNEIALAVRTLPPRLRHLMKLIYFDGLNQTQAAKRLGIVQARVSVLHAEALFLLRWFLAGRN